MVFADIDCRSVEVESRCEIPGSTRWWSVAVGGLRCSVALCVCVMRDRRRSEMSADSERPSSGAPRVLCFLEIIRHLHFSHSDHRRILGGRGPVARAGSHARPMQHASHRFTPPRSSFHSALRSKVGSGPRVPNRVSPHDADDGGPNPLDARTEPLGSRCVDRPAVRVRTGTPASAPGRFPGRKGLISL